MSADTIIYEIEPPEKRDRLAVFFRAILIIPHIITLMLYGIGAYFAVIIAWFALLFTGRYPEGLYNFVANVVRYVARVQAYACVAVDAYPPFDLGEHPEYPVRLHIGPPKAEYSRVKVFFRVILYIPVYVINYALNIISGLFAVLVWIVAVIVGRTPEGLAAVQKFCLSYGARSTAYAALLTEDWPAISQDDATVAAARSGGFASDAFQAPAPPPPPPPASTSSMTPPPPPAGPNPFGA
jgi:hypothetical protein